MIMKHLLQFLCTLFFLPTFSQKVVEVNLKAPGTLRQHLTEQALDSCQKLIIHGHINSADIRTIRSIAYCTMDDHPRGQLQVLDLRDARIDKDKSPYLTIDVVEERADMHLTTIVGSSRASSSSRYALESMAGEYEYLQPDWYRKDYKYDWLKRNRWIKLTLLLNESDATPAYSNVRVSSAIWLDTSNEKEWDHFKQTIGYKQPGYTFTEQDGKHLFSLYTLKNHVSDAMFYHCTSLRTVMLPQKIKLDTTVKVWNKYPQIIQYQN